MIIVDVYIPSLDRTYNFNLDEDAKIRVLIEEISELICKKEHSSLDGARERFILGVFGKQICFHSEYSLREYSIKNGDKLILV